MDLPYQLSIHGVVDFQTIDRSLFTHIISIWHPNPNLQVFQENMEIGFPQSDIHFGIFQDVEGDHQQGPESHHVEAALQYAQSVPSGAHLLIHCMAGISRSTAISMAILAQKHGAGSELEIATYIREIRPQANPNRLICALADEILGTQLEQAADEVFGHSYGESNKGWDQQNRDQQD